MMFVKRKWLQEVSDAIYPNFQNFPALMVATCRSPLEGSSCLWQLKLLQKNVSWKPLHYHHPCVSTMNRCTHDHIIFITIKAWQYHMNMVWKEKNTMAIPQWEAIVPQKESKNVSMSRVNFLMSTWKNEASSLVAFRRISNLQNK